VQTVRYPNTRRDEVTETIGGITFEDPYRWLETDTEDALDWEENQNAMAEAYLHEWPGYGRLCDVIGPHFAEMLTFAPQPCGGRWFQMAVEGAALVICVSEQANEPGKVLLDPGSISDGRPSLDWFYPSPDGRYVVFGLSQGGTEQSVLHVIETESGRVLPERIPHASFAKVAWLPDSSGFYYNAGIAPDTEQADKFIFFHRPGHEPPSEPEPVRVREEYVQPQISADGRYLAVLPSEIEPRPDYVKDIAGDGKWRPFLRDQSGVFIGVFVGDSYVAITTDGAPRGRLVAVPLDGGHDRSTWRELLPESEAVLRSVSLVGERLVIAELVDGYSRIRVLSLEGEPEEEVQLPGDGNANVNATWWGHVIIDPMVASGESECAFTFSTFTQSPSVYRYDVRSRHLERIKEPKFDLGHLTTERLSCEGRDGAKVTLWAVRRTDGEQPAPAFIYGYGGWNIAFLPIYLGIFAPFVEAGGTMVFANLRGGGEHGWDWWQAGRLAGKQVTYDDLYAVAEFLIAEGMTTAHHLAVAGASNGGLLTGAAVTQRPDLFKAVVSQVPLLDLMRYTRDAYTAECTEEYGDPRKPEEAAWVYAYSPYHNVREGTSYPATLVVCGEEDIRCPRWHGRKTVARLQHATTSEAPILLRVWSGAGHLAGLLGEPEKSAEWIGFVMHQLGMEP
jgi:prolyl oligopeptidase